MQQFKEPEQEDTSTNMLWWICMPSRQHMEDRDILLGRIRGAIHAHQKKKNPQQLLPTGKMIGRIWCSITSMYVCCTIGSANICINHSISVSQMAWWLESQSNFGMHVWLRSWPMKIMRCNCWIKATLMFAYKKSQSCTVVKWSEGIKLVQLLPTVLFFNALISGNRNFQQQRHQTKIYSIFFLKFPYMFLICTFWSGDV